MHFTPEETKFMGALASSEGQSWKLPLANREQDRARQRLRRLNLVRFDRKRWVWSMTEAGQIEWANRQRP